MATGIIYRRFAGQSCRAAAFSTTTRAWGQKMLFGNAEESRSAITMGKGAKAAISLGLWASPEYSMSINPSAYQMAKRLHHEDASRSLRDGSLEGDSSAVGPKQIRSTYHVSSTQRLSGEEGVLLEDDEVLSGEHPLKRGPMKNDRHDYDDDDDDDMDTEVYDSKEHTRIFQKQRPEYRSLCYNREEFSQSLSTEEGESILQKVSLIKSGLKPEAIAEYFFRLSCLPAEQRKAVLSNFRFDMLCNYGIKNVKMFSTADLITILKAFVTLRIPPSHFMLKNYEKEFCSRAWDMSLNLVLLVADLWCYLGRSVPCYLEIMLTYVNQHWKELTLPQLVQLSYIIGEGRKAPEELMKKLDLLMSRYLDSLSLEEVGVICLGFFKSKSCLSDATMQRIGLKTCAHLADISNCALVNILKMYRLTYHGHIYFLKHLGQLVPSRMQTMTVQSIMHIALACSALHYFDKGLMDNIAYSVPPKVASCRCKDVAKLLWSFGNLNYVPPNADEFYTRLEEQLHVKFHEFQKFPEHLVTALVALALVKRFHYDLIDYALSPKFIGLCREGQYYPDRDLLTLDGTVEIECPDYAGNRLSPQFRQEAVNRVYSYARQDFCIKPEIIAAMSVLEEMLGGPQYVKKHLILPHNRTVDLEVCLDANQNPLPFNSEAVVAEPLTLTDHGVFLTNDLMDQLLKGKSRSQTLLVDGGNKTEKCVQKRAVQLDLSLSTGNHRSFSDGVPLTGLLFDALTKTTSKDPDPQPTEQVRSGRKLAIQVSTRNHYALKSKHLLGFHNMKRRQLRQIGYVVIEVPFWEWSPLLKHSYSHKREYLYHKVFGSSSEREPECPAKSEF
ncbi:FAST kinase domain-containing protein 5, mitochondrial [Pogona vitticeps]